MPILPRLRPQLDMFPSPSKEHPGLVLRDPFGYSDSILIIPPLFVAGLICFDGEQTELDLQNTLARQVEQEIPAEVARGCVEALRTAGFLETEEFAAMREKREAEFRASPVRAAAHVGGAYPARPEALRKTMAKYFADDPAADSPSLVGIAAPHVSPEGGYRSYAAAYRKITPALADRTFVILGTSHYGTPEKFGLTRKPYVTPLGSAEVDTALMDMLVKRAPGAVIQEDYCHAFEHTIEFQVLFLQYVMGRPVKVLPILVGQFVDSLMNGNPPESQDDVRRFFDALGEMSALRGNSLFWLMGIDMAHIGARYGHNFAAFADQGPMESVAARDRERLEAVCAGDSAGFLELVKPDGDDLNWCGYSALYTFLRAMPKAHGRLLRYEQWNIDPQSVVSFGGLEFS